MIEEVTRYRTKDGRLHDSEESATEHIVEAISNKVGPIIDQSGIGIRDRLRVVEALVGTPEKALLLKAMLGELV